MQHFQAKWTNFRTVLADRHETFVFEGNAPARIETIDPLSGIIGHTNAGSARASSTALLGKPTAFTGLASVRFAVKRFATLSSSARASSSPADS